MINTNELKNYNDELDNINIELQFYNSVIFVQHFLVFVVGTSCEWIEYKNKTNSLFSILKFTDYLTENCYSLIDENINKNFIENYLFQNNKSIYFRIIHKFVDQKTNNDNYKIEFYFFTNNEFKQFKVFSFFCPENFFSLAVYSQFLKKIEYDNKTLYKIDWEGLETIQNNLLNLHKIKSRYFFELLQKNSEEKSIYINKKVTKI